MRVNTNLPKISQIQENRLSEVFTPPDSWNNNDVEFLPDVNYTISENVSISGISTFGSRQMIIDVISQQGTAPSFKLMGKEKVIADCNNVESGKNNIKIGDIKICEHVLSLAQGLGLQLDYELSDDNFPSFNNGLEYLIDALKFKTIECGQSQFITVKEPMMFEFDNSGYFILEPDQGEHKLIVDHQFSHNNTLGDQRVNMMITPELFFYISTARAVSTGLRTQLAKVFLDKFGKLPYFGLDYNNIVFVDKNNILNPNLKFDDNGINREILMHEVIDKIGSLGLFQGKRFVGKIITFLTNHKKDIEVMKYISENNLLTE